MKPQFFALSFLLLACSCTAQAQQPAATKIVLIGTKPDHPYASHMYMFECGLLAKCLQQTPGVKTEIHYEWPAEERAFDGAAAVVFYSRPAGDIVLAPEHRAPFQEHLSRGMGYSAIHWATNSNEQNKADYLKILGGWFHRPPCGIKITTSKLVQLDPSHAICRGWQEYDLHDEFYLNLAFDPAARPLLKVHIDGLDQVVAWTFERPNSSGGRSFGTTLGHYHENFGIRAFRQAVVNGILWSARVEVPAGGAPIALRDDDLKLPPPEKPQNK